MTCTQLVVTSSAPSKVLGNGARMMTVTMVATNAHIITPAPISPHLRYLEYYEMKQELNTKLLVELFKGDPIIVTFLNEY